MKRLWLEIKAWDGGWFQFLKYDFKLTLWMYTVRMRNLFAFTQKHSGFLFRIGFVGFGFIAGIATSKLGGYFFTQDILSNYLIAIGAMAGGAMAIVFTISIFLLQKAADMYSSQYFEAYAHDWKERIVYFIVIVITLLFFASGLYVGSVEVISDELRSLIILVSLPAIGMIFALIDWQYKIVRTKISPTNTIDFLEKQALKFVKKMHGDAQRVSDVMIARDKKLDKKEALAGAYNMFFQPYVDNLNRQLENIAEISLRLAERQEINSTKRGFYAIQNILLGFLDARKTSSLAMLSDAAFLAVVSDSNRFWFNNLDRINKAAEVFIKTDKEENATYLINIYGSLAEKSVEMEHIGVRTGENPTFETITGNFQNLVSIGMRTKNLELVFQSIPTIEKIALLAIKHNQQTTLHGIQDKLLKIALHGLEQRHTIIVDRCSVAFLNIMKYMVISDYLATHLHLKSTLQNIASITKLTLTAINNKYLADDFSTSFCLTKGYDNLYEAVVEIYQYYEQLTDEEKKDKVRTNLLHLFDELSSSLRTLSEQAKTADSQLAGSIARLLFNINNLMMHLIADEDFSQEKRELERRLLWNIHLPYWFLHHAEKFDAGSLQLRDLAESVAKSCLIGAARLNNAEVLENGIKCIASMAEQALSKNSNGYGFSEPRLIKMMCFLGVIALQKDWKKALNKCVLEIRKFEKAYKEKYFSNLPPHIDASKLRPGKNALFDEIFDWRDDFEHNRLNRMRIREDSEDMMYDFVELADIDRFIFKIWRTYSPNSPIVEEIENELKRNLVKRLAKTLTLIAQKRM